MSTIRFSVVIPLYNKATMVAAAIRSVLAQRLPAAEILVVDDGSTDGSAAVVRDVIASEAAGNIPVRLIEQPNRGVSVARNRGVEEATGSHIALLDADDSWEPTFLEEVAALIGDYPDCGLYATAFYVVTEGGERHTVAAPERRGVVENFFRDSAHRYIAIPSAVVIPREVYLASGGFPSGMKISEDLHLWIRLARRYRVAFSPKRLVNYTKAAPNRSAAIYTPECCEASFEALYDPDAPVDDCEFVARAALGRALVQCVKGATAEAARAAQCFAYTRTYRTTLWKIRVLNRLPVAWRAPLLNGYNRLAWLIAKRGL